MDTIREPNTFGCTYYDRETGNVVLDKQYPVRFSGMMETGADKVMTDFLANPSMLYMRVDIDEGCVVYTRNPDFVEG